MVLTNAERSKRFRERKKSNPISHDEYKRKERERYQKRKSKGEFDLSKKTKREWRILRRKWRHKKRKAKLDKTESQHLQGQNIDAEPSTSSKRESEKMRGRKKVRKDRASCYRELFKLKKKLKAKNRKYNKYKQKYHRLEKKQGDKNELKTNDILTSPGRLASEQLRGNKEQVKKH